MICSQCGNNVAEGAAACPGCGARPGTGRGASVRMATVPAAPSGPIGPGAGPGGHGMGAGPAGQGGPAGPYAAAGPGMPGAPGTQAGPGARGPMGPMGAAPSAAPAFNLDLKRLTRNDQIVGGAAVVFVISLFLPWFTVSAGVFSASVDGLWHGYMYITLILAIALLAYLVLRAGFEELPFKLPLDHESAMLVATAVIFVLTVLSFVFKPAGVADAFASVSWGWSFGAFIGLIAAVAAVTPLGLPFLRSRTGR
jgi:hypothetical protein